TLEWTCLSLLARATKRADEPALLRASGPSDLTGLTSVPVQSVPLTTVRKCWRQGSATVWNRAEVLPAAIGHGLEPCGSAAGSDRPRFGTVRKCCRQRSATVWNRAEVLPAAIGHGLEPCGSAAGSDRPRFGSLGSAAGSDRPRF